MKKILITLCFLGTIQFINAQEVGVRFGDSVGGDFAIDGVFSVGKYNRVHADLSFGYGVGIDALFDFIYRPLPIGEENFNWYVGAGPSLVIGDPFLLGASGEIGLEYHFKQIPIVIGADWRPTFWIIEDTDFHAGGFGVNIRYNFSK